MSVIIAPRCFPVSGQLQKMSQSAVASSTAAAPRRLANLDPYKPAHPRTSTLSLSASAPALPRSTASRVLTPDKRSSHAGSETILSVNIDILPHEHPSISRLVTSYPSDSATNLTLPVPVNKSNSFIPYDDIFFFFIVLTSPPIISQRRKTNGRDGHSHAEPGGV